MQCNSINYLGLWKDTNDRAIPIKVGCNPANSTPQIKQAIHTFLEELERQPGTTKTGFIAFQY